MPRVRSRWPNQQHTARINWGDRLTKGLRHAIVPGLAGVDNPIPDLADKRCYFAIYYGTNRNPEIYFYHPTAPDIAAYENAYSPVAWGLFGPTMTWYQGGEFSIFIRFWPLSPSGIFGVGGYPYPGWEMIQYGGGFQNIFGQFGVWTVAGLSGYSANSGFGQAYQWQTGGFTWRGSDQKFSGYKDGIVGSQDVTFYGTPAWNQLGGGSNPGIDLWKCYGIDATTPVLGISHLYMWDRELMTADMLRLSANPMAIFSSPRPTLWMAGVETDIEPPEPPTGTSQPLQHHILGAV